MKKLIKQLLENKLLGEAAVNVNDLPETTALFIKESRFGDVLILFDIKLEKAFGIISIHKFAPMFCEVTHVAAEKGYGPLIYKLGMMLVTTKGMFLFQSRDGDVRSGAMSVWEKFYDSNETVKHELRPSGKYFSFNILGDDYYYDDMEEFNEILEILDFKERKAAVIFNTGMRITETTPLKQLKARGDMFISKGFDINIAYNAGDDLWNEKYD